MKAAGIADAHVVRILGNKVFIISESSQEEMFERIASVWGSVICVEEDTLELASFECGRLLIELASLDRIEYRVDLNVLDEIFPLRVFEAELLLRGPSLGCMDQREGSSSDHGESSVRLEASTAGNSQAIEVEEELWDAEGVALDDSLQTVHICSNIEVILYKGNWRKIRMLEEVIRSVQSPEEVVAEAHRKKKGCGRPRKGSVVLTGNVATESPSDCGYCYQ
ncbi:hypothetical protein V6N13_135475 [Hibiscus sabdariffa]